MNPTSRAIIDFVDHFQLMDADGVVNFNADIEFKSENVVERIKSEVFVLSINPKNVDAVNLLNTDIAEMDYPVMFQSGREAFSYIDGVCLIIVGNNAEKGDYVVSIFPENPPVPGT